jgi:DNA polymerase III alpha subunit
MNISKFGEIILDENDIFQGLYSEKITNLSSLNIENQDLIDQFNRARTMNADMVPNLVKFESKYQTQEEFDQANQKQWFMPIEYKNMEIEEYILSLCNTDEEFTRVGEELVLFHQHNMIEVLKYLKYLVDTMRSNNVVWGVGRGSAVASYCLYLLGVHKINSLKYNLDIAEFLR